MKFSALQEFDSSIKLVFGEAELINVEGISHSDNPEEHKFIFIKSSKFLKNIGRRSSQDSYLSSGVVFDCKYYETLSEDQLKDISSLFSWGATVTSIDQSMCKLSKPFYDLLYEDLNYQVDGRQFNNAIIDPTAQISQNVFIGENVKIGKNTKILPGCTILSEVEIGENNIIFPNVTIYPYTAIGNNNRIHAGTVIGTDGFGYNFYDGKHNKIWHLSGVKIGNDVEIGCNSMIDSGAFIATQIDDGTKIDNDVQISHNVWVKKNVVICGKTGLAGSVEVDDYCGFGAGAGVAPSARLEQGVQVAARAVVSENAHIKSGQVVAGHPARPLKEWMRSQATLRRLAKNK